MWSVYTGFSEVFYSNIPSITRLGSSFGSFYTKINDDPPDSASTEYLFTEYSPEAGYTIAGGSIAYTKFYDETTQTIVSSLNITSRLDTTTKVKAEYVLQTTSLVQSTSFIAGTYTQETTNSTDSPTKTLFTRFTYNNLTQTTSLVNIDVTSITTSGPTVLVGFSNSDLVVEETSKTGVYMVVHPTIGYPWTSDHQTMQFMQTFTYNSSLPDNDNVIEWVNSGTNTGGLTNIVAENNRSYPRTISESVATSVFDLIYDSGTYPTSGGTITVVTELTSTISYESLTSTQTTASIQSRYVYISSLSRFTTTQSLSSSVTSWSTSTANETTTLREQLTLFFERDPDGENTYFVSASVSNSYSNAGSDDTVFSSGYVSIGQRYGYYYRTVTQVGLSYATSTYTHVNSGMNGVYFNTFTFKGLGLTTVKTTGASYWGDFTSRTFLSFSTSGQNNAIIQRNVLVINNISFTDVKPFPGRNTLSFTHGINVSSVNRIYAFSGYDQPEVTTYIRSPNYNFAIGTTKTNGYLDIRHGGYVEKINPETLLTKCFWSYYKFERTANINVPVLAYPMNTESTDTSGTTIQSAQIPIEFFNGKDKASIYRTTLAGTAQTTTSHTCSYGATEQYKNMILESMALDDISYDVLATAGNISRNGAKFELGETFSRSDYAFCFYLGKTFYFEYAPIRRTIGVSPSPHSAIGENGLIFQNLFTLVQSTNSGFPFTFSSKPYLVSFTSMQ